MWHKRDTHPTDTRDLIVERQFVIVVGSDSQDASNLAPGFRFWAVYHTYNLVTQFPRRCSLPQSFLLQTEDITKPSKRVRILPCVCFRSIRLGMD